MSLQRPRQVSFCVMPTMDTADFRASFRRFAGHDRYSKFVRAINRACRSKGRLFFWQEQLWDEFATTIPDVPTSGNEVLAAFSVCDVHDCPLQSPPDDKPLAEIRDTPENELAYNALFPFAINGNLVCPQCRAAREKWIEENAELCAVLRCKTTYEEYCSRRLEGLVQTADVSEKIKKRSAEIAAQMEPGDELWEWDMGGWHHLAGSAGVAILRKGKIVKQWCEWKS